MNKLSLTIHLTEEQIIESKYIDFSKDHDFIFNLLKNNGFKEDKEGQYIIINRKRMRVDIFVIDVDNIELKLIYKGANK